MRHAIIILALVVLAVAHAMDVATLDDVTMKEIKTAESEVAVAMKDMKDLQQVEGREEMEMQKSRDDFHKALDVDMQVSVKAGASKRFKAVKDAQSNVALASKQEKLQTKESIHADTALKGLQKTLAKSLSHLAIATFPSAESKHASVVVTQMAKKALEKVNSAEHVLSEGVKGHETQDRLQRMEHEVDDVVKAYAPPPGKSSLLGEGEKRFVPHGSQTGVLDILKKAEKIESHEDTPAIIHKLLQQDRKVDVAELADTKEFESLIQQLD